MTTHPYNDTETAGEAGVIRGAVEWMGANWRRLLKFGLVGGLGVVVNWVFFELGVAAGAGLGERISYGFGVTLGIVVSIFTNFVFNDVWTWGDRAKQGGMAGWLDRMLKYYVGASVAAGVQFVVFWISLDVVWGPLGWVFVGGTVPGIGVEIPAFPLAPRLALLTGIAMGMVINFLAGHLWAFREVDT